MNETRSGLRCALEALATTLLLFPSLALPACAGPAGPPGEQGNAGPASSATGPTGDAGTPGPTGDAGTPGRNAYLTVAGLQIQIQGVTIAGTSATVTFQITDGAGTPLDLEGIYTEGAVDVHLALAWLAETADTPPQALQYTSYITNTAGTQATEDTGGFFADVDPLRGVYSYTLGAAITVADPTNTHTIAARAARPFEGETYVADAVLDFLPGGGAPTVLRSIVDTTACNACHDPLEAHDGLWREVRACVLCHSPQTVDAAGNTVDFKRMVHTIHRGNELAGVLAGIPYQLVDDQQNVHDFSTVGYPQALQRCDTCHTGTEGQRWQTEPSQALCTSCHDQVWFGPGAPPNAWMTPHPGNVQPTNAQCTTCHPPTNGLEPIVDVHLTPATDPTCPVLALAIQSVMGTAPGSTPEIVFAVTENGAPYDLLANPLTRLAVTVAGPTTDYASYFQETIQGSGATGALTLDGTVGTYLYVFPSPIPASAVGTYAFGLEGTITATCGGSSASTIGALNPIAFAPVTDATAVPRRTIVALSQCNNCHDKLEAHGGLRQEVQYCSFCHNPNKVDDSGVSRIEGETVTAPGLSLPVMIHKIHMGAGLTNQPYVLGGYPTPSPSDPAGTQTDFGTVLYPGDIKACWACHAGATYTVPLPYTILPALTAEVLTCTDPSPVSGVYCDTLAVVSETSTPPTTAACTACHDAPYVLAHAQTNTAANGVEACATCHGPGAAYDVQGAHAPSP
jgi:OmcA/MtrC family decaheme c-type cytochrome